MTSEALNAFSKKYIYSDDITCAREAAAGIANAASGAEEIELYDAANAYDTALARNEDVTEHFVKLLDAALAAMQSDGDDWSKEEKRIKNNRTYLAVKLVEVQRALKEAKSETDGLVAQRGELLKQASENGWSYGQLSELLGISRAMLHRVASR